MQLQLLAFAQAHDQLGFRERLVECSPTETPRQILARLAPYSGLRDHARRAGL
jgi:hypothetical protein